MLHTVTFIRLLPIYSGWSRKNLGVMLLPASLMASSSDGSKTSQVAKLRLQKYLAGIPAAFLIPASLLVLISVILKESLILPLLQVLEWAKFCFLESILHIFFVFCVVLRRLFLRAINASLLVGTTFLCKRDGAGRK